ncbi:hypothetical protein ABZ835_08935 [Streptomyces sp. NPDC047461]|uniref:hypothetical protein n=1 Tax=Streptomyces sp. NPDC047461 TaxID=3155619 RepID=UPI00340F3C32
MVVLAVLIPLLMLGTVLALGRYEELLLPAEREEAVPLPPTSSPGPAGTPAASP